MDLENTCVYTGSTWHAIISRSTGSIQSWMGANRNQILDLDHPISFPVNGVYAVKRSVFPLDWRIVADIPCHSDSGE